MFVTESRIVDDSVEMNQGSNISDGDIYINTESIDELFLDKGISFIKMGIEGAETEVLKGGAATIKKYKPKLAISVYHKKDDIYEIILLIK